ncbi:MAG: hypothetical protein ACOCQB_02180 [Halanaerobiaceae bacterium]
MQSNLLRNIILTLYVIIALIAAWYMYGLDIWQEIQDKKWERYILEETRNIHDVVMTEDNNYLAVGATNNSSQYIYKIDDRGQILFKKKLDYGVTKIVPAQGENHLLFSNDKFILINDQGKILLDKTINIEPEVQVNESIGFNKIISVHNGYIIAGTSSDETFIVKVDDQGDLLWFENFSIINNLEDILQIDDENLLVLGSDLGEDLNVVLKLDHEGKLLKKKIFKSFTYSHFQSIQPTGNNEFVIAGTHVNYDNKKSGIIIKGDFQKTDWHRTIGAESDLDINLDELIKTKDDILLALGSKNEGIRGGSYNGYIIKLTPAGEILWKKSYGTQGSDMFTGFIESGNGFVVFGDVSDPVDYPGSVGCIFKIDSEGNIADDFFIEGESLN